MRYLYLAILFEVIGTSALKSSDGFSRWLPGLIVLVGYGLSFYFLSLSLKSVAVGTAYAIWSGVGIVLIAVIGFFAFGQKIDRAGLLGMALIVAGVVTLNLFSHSEVH